MDNKIHVHIFWSVLKWLQQCALSLFVQFHEMLELILILNLQVTGSVSQSVTPTISKGNQCYLVSTRFDLYIYFLSCLPKELVRWHSGVMTCFKNLIQFLFCFQCEQRISSSKSKFCGWCIHGVKTTRVPCTSWFPCKFFSACPFF